MDEKINYEIPKKGDLVKLRNGTIAKVTTVIGSDRWGRVEVVVDGTRGYVAIEDIEVLNALERIVKEL